MKYFVVSLLLSVVILELVSAQRGGGIGLGKRAIEDTENHDPQVYGRPGRSIEDTKKRDPQGSRSRGLVEDDY